MFRYNAVSLLILIYFGLRLQGIEYHVTSFWKFPLVILGVYCIVVLFKYHLSRVSELVVESRWIIFSLVVLGINYKLERGNFRLDELFEYFIISLVFYVVGIIAGLNRQVAIFRGWILILFLSSSFYCLIKIVTIISFSSFSRSTVIESFYGESGGNGLMFFFPYIAFLVILAYNLCIKKIKNRTVKLVMYSLCACCLVLFIISTFAASFVFAGLALLAILLIKKDVSALKYISALGLFSLSGYVFIYIAGTEAFGSLGPISDKSRAMLDLMETLLISEDSMNAITSDRWSGMVYSLEQFSRAPIFGHGIYLESVSGMLGSSSNYTTVSGGHSFFIDLFAFLGVFAIPFILIYSKFAVDAYKDFSLQKSNQKIHATFFGLLIAIIVSNILNSWLLFSSFDQLIFLCGGFLLGLRHVPDVRFRKLKERRS